MSAEGPDTIVYITASGSKYHEEGCGYLRKSCYEISLEQAVSRGYTPCSRCYPPILDSEYRQSDSFTIIYDTQKNTPIPDSRLEQPTPTISSSIPQKREVREEGTAPRSSHDIQIMNTQSKETEYGYISFVFIFLIWFFTHFDVFSNTNTSKQTLCSTPSRDVQAKRQIRAAAVHQLGDLEKSANVCAKKLEKMGRWDELASLSQDVEMLKKRFYSLSVWSNLSGIEVDEYYLTHWTFDANSLVKKAVREAFYLTSKISTSSPSSQPSLPQPVVIAPHVTEMPDMAITSENPPHPSPSAENTPTPLESVHRVKLPRRGILPGQISIWDNQESDSSFDDLLLKYRSLERIVNEIMFRRLNAELEVPNEYHILYFPLVAFAMEEAGRLSHSERVSLVQGYAKSSCREAGFPYETLEKTFENLETKFRNALNEGNWGSIRTALDLTAMDIEFACRPEASKRGVYVGKSIGIVADVILEASENFPYQRFP